MLSYLIIIITDALVLILIKKENWVNFHWQSANLRSEPEVEIKYFLDISQL